ncbi:tRNA (guanine-N(7)-)-methyltransferase non-catalytic subunit wuho [Zancudomyces culisetae]|uniref:tRNA (Guanine-N(7)-)-methyltransferase non-catalytic subunit wuho n=1 Tax=Zancudomyces culisetae TaxID=1213189 RepID=A0A1R1PK63_ZANCU|nr:tRNA (guanine-N(7)-)-methyltransferase non-catalytic subunit wuho [Zancudomyces culisetae]|eukprot:OMH81355.1 tRNA (guanine-N(7)-)-methyltransferase non-catalytic subunit wuho [Zancudomyces culisetae]
MNCVLISAKKVVATTIKGLYEPGSVKELEDVKTLIETKDIIERKAGQSEDEQEDEGEQEHNVPPTRKKAKLDNTNVDYTIKASTTSVNGDLLGVITNSKHLLVYKIPEFSIANVLKNAKACNAVCFDSSGENVLVADKFGDVVKFNLSGNAPPEIILGHVSILTDMAFRNGIQNCDVGDSTNSEYVVTADRDEKIRISCYPNAYEIQSYCLGHKEFVTSINIPSINPNIIISGSGDLAIKVWELLTGKELLTVETNEILPTQELKSKNTFGSTFESLDTDPISEIKTPKVDHFSEPPTTIFDWDSAITWLKLDFAVANAMNRIVCPTTAMKKPISSYFFSRFIAFYAP